MKLHRMKIPALLGALLITAMVHGQGDEPKTTKPTPVPQKDSWTTFNIDFPGGTAEALVQEVAKQSGTRPNVIIPEQMEKLMLPRFKLQNVSSAQVFESLNLIIDEKGAQHFRWLSQGAKEDPHTVWILARIPVRPAAETCQVWSIGNLLEAYQLEEINTAIRATWEMVGAGSSPALKFHSETKLLIARGNEQELKLAEEVLAQLQVGIRTKKTGGTTAAQ